MNQKCKKNWSSPMKCKNQPVALNDLQCAFFSIVWAEQQYTSIYFQWANKQQRKIKSFAGIRWCFFLLRRRSLNFEIERARSLDSKTQTTLFSRFQMIKTYKQKRASTQYQMWNYIFMVNLCEDQATHYRSPIYGNWVEEAATSRSQHEISLDSSAAMSRFASL